jgi:response regulator RpfG family c-di-GMP phosphodiesterase
MIDDLTLYLSNNPLFSGLDSNALQSIASRFRRVTFLKDAIIFNEGESGNKMFILTAGEVSIQKGMGWKQRELKRMRSGEMFGEMALIVDEKRTATARVVTDAECLELGKADFSQFIDENVAFAHNVLRLLTDRLKRFDEFAFKELLDAHQALIFSLAKLAESRDPETGAHLYRVRDYCTLLCTHLAQHDNFNKSITPHIIENIYFVSPLHDIGKVAIPDNILLKKDKLTKEEFEIMKTHSRHGAVTIKAVQENYGQTNLEMAHNIVLHHHERYDGKGYPEGLEGEDIPLEARIMALADVYDALLTVRPYKPAFSYKETFKIVKENAGSQFDPFMTEVMLDNIKGFEKIHHKYRD